SYEKYSKAGFADIFSKDDLQGARVLRSETFATTYFENKGNGEFSIIPLPRSVQISPAYGLLAEDIHSDRHMDLLFVGTSYANDGFVGRDDAGTGPCLLGDGKGNFQAINNLVSGFRADLDA